MIDLDDLRRRSERLARESRNEFEATALQAAAEVKRVSPPPPRRPLTAADIVEMGLTQGGICPLCDQELGGEQEVDHRVPVTYGGGNERPNLQLVHMRCNRQKRARVDPHELLAYTQDRYRNRQP